MQVTYKTEGGKRLREHETLPYGNIQCEPVPRVGDEVDVGDGLLYTVVAIRWTPGQYKIEVFVRSKT